ncbi:MAG: hypothetical protein KDD53_10280, partial [Bdellovibrionales bacterium]|nr:hypothetical protein [Bdellovibrionales bacterium]
MKARFIIALLICISFFVHLQNSEIADPPGVNSSQRVDFSGAGDLGPSWIPPLLERSWYRWISFKDAPITICRSKPSRELDPDRAFVETLVSQ